MSPLGAYTSLLLVLATTHALDISSFSGVNPSPIDHITSSWDQTIFTKLGGFSPWFPTTGIYGIPGTDIPESCTLTQVQLYMRHVDRLASGGTHKGIQALAAKLANASYAFKTSDPNLQYLQKFQWTVPAEYLSPLGTISAHAAGTAAIHRYSCLFPENAYYNWTGVPNVQVRSTDQERVNATAQAYMEGMLGPGWASRSDWQIQPDSLTTFNSTLASNNCPAVNTINSQANSIFTKYFYPLVQKRLAPLMSGFNLSTTDIAGMMNACAFDSFVRQSPSPICNIFTAEEWKGYNYAYDLTQFDNAGYGGPIGTAWGVGWVSEMIGRLNGTIPISVGSINTTLDADPTTFPLNSSIYLDFGHDSTLESIVTAMGLLKASYDGNVTLSQIDPNRAWQSALISPMGGRLYVEKMNCAGNSNQTYIRMLLNDAVLPLYTLPECQHSWGADQGLCELPSFIASQSFALSGANFTNCSNNYTGVAL